MNYRKIAVPLLVFCMIISACSSQTDNSNDKETLALQEQENSTEEAADSQDNVLNADEMFSDRDKEIGYEESTAVYISLKNGQSECNSDTVEISEDTVTIKGEGTFVLSGSLSNGQIVVDAQKTDKIQLVFNNVNINCDTSAALYIKQADKVFLTLDGNSENTLSNQEDFIAIDDNNIDGVIFSKDDLTLNGTGTLTVRALYGHGVVSKDDLVFAGGTYDIEAKSHAISAKQSIRIANGDFLLKAQKDGIHARDTEDTTLGFVYIAGGTITIEESEEGIEGRMVQIDGGTITLTASDDGINAAGGSTDSSGRGTNPMAVETNSYIRISGGSIDVNAGGDGLDSNGNLYVSGGEIYVSGSLSGGDGAIDYNGEAVITGGIFAASGVSGMEQNFGSSSTQASILVNCSQRQEKAIVLKDVSGKELLSYTPPKAYNSVVISTPDITQGETYEVVLGDESVTVEMTNLIYGNGSLSGHGGQENGRMGQGGGQVGHGNGHDMKKTDHANENGSHTNEHT